MFKEVIILVLAAVACLADVPAPSQGVYCGEIPSNLYKCSQLPLLFTADAVSKCMPHVTLCAKLTCMFTAIGCFKDGKVDKKKTSEFFDAYAARLPGFTAAANHAKAACLRDKDLPAQGTNLDCPAFDVLHCILISFIRNVPTSNWLKVPECESTRQYAQSCPICPTECFAAQVPNDSCHACLSLPRSA